MHDRRINGQAHTFGNEGALFMNAMTWWDHETGSIWSQPVGQAIDGPLEGTVLSQIPSGVVPWSTWLAEHPGTLALEVERGFLGSGRQAPSDNFVIGVALGEHARAYPFPVAAREGVVNDRLGPFPLLVQVEGESRAIHVYFRQAGEQELTFEAAGDRLRDRETGSLWHPATGLALEGPLKGELLEPVPYSSAFDWAWLDFYPESDLYGGGNG